MVIFWILVKNSLNLKRSRVSLNGWSLIQSEIKENSKTHGKLYSVKEAVVNLDTGSNQPLFINQYQVKRADRETVDRQVKKWFDNGVTMLLEVGAT